jgi:hypothetical protein
MSVDNKELYVEGQDNIDVEIEQFHRLRNILYALKGAGGNLHVITDDDNLEDWVIYSCRKCIEACDEPIWFKHVQLAMLDLLELYPEGSKERYAINDGLFL